MKKQLLILLITIPVFSSLFSQTNSIKNYPLKDYIAPEIEYRRMDLGTQMNLNGGDTFEENKAQNYINANFNLYYYEYLNLAKVQRTEVSTIYIGYSSTWNKNDTVKYSSYYMPVRLNYLTQTRLYRKNNRFWGIHGNLKYYLNPSANKKTSEEKIKEFGHIFNITPYISLGKGRIQPIESARQAMDILLSLQKYNRLAVTPDKSMIDSLARVVNRIRYKRFFDFRFKIIYQLEELDKALQSMGLVDTADIIYFANLNDIWNYAQTFKRGSGVRYEGGLIPEFSASQTKEDDPNVPEKLEFKNMNYGVYGFFSFNRMRPVSYAWQSNLMIDLTFGVDQRVTKRRDDTAGETLPGHFRSMLNASWQFGYFPNTRTFMGITPYTALTFTKEKDAGNTFGINTGFRFDSYYYISPRLRLNLSANFYYVNDFDGQVPTPFWNTVTYTEQSINNLRRTNADIPYPVNANVFVKNGIAYDFSFSLRYALF
ncbi:MAG: hypothetical protein GXO86_11990 [Chlorobi bacterium]|nr:hypothetical protein [Chlorobiota bacterium]